MLGDIVNSQPVYVGKPFFKYDDSGYATFENLSLNFSSGKVKNRPPIVIVGANDGMLHAFHASGPTGGREAWAFVPSAVTDNLYRLADRRYDARHKYFVDATPTVADVKVGGVWRTILVSGLAKGGRGYFALDITNTEHPQLLWEFKASDACFPQVLNSDCNVGLAYGNPVIGKLKSADGPEGDWVVVLSSGYNNVAPGDGKGYLYVLDVATGKIRYRIGTGVGDAEKPSGLSPLAAFVKSPHTDATLERVYGGDLQGNLWRFDLNDVIAPAGREATLLASLRSPNGIPQSIVVRPELGEVKGKPFVFVATGKFLERPDLKDETVQSVYAIHDRLGSGLSKPRDELQQVALKNVTLQNTQTRTTAKLPCSSGCSGENGWFIDLTGGERVSSALRLQLGTLFFASNEPNGDQCSPGGTGWLNYVDFRSGSAVLGHGARAAFKVDGAMIAGFSTVLSSTGDLTAVVVRSDSTIDTTRPDRPGGGSELRRMNWREVLE